MPEIGKCPDVCIKYTFKSDISSAKVSQVYSAENS